MAFSTISIHLDTITSLANQVSSLSKSISSYLHEHAYDQPGFLPSSAAIPDTPEYKALRNKFNDASNDLYRLINGSENFFRTWTWMISDLAALQTALSHKFFKHIPDDDIGLAAAAVADKAGIHEGLTTCILKILATHRIFEETSDTKFRHTASSKYLRTSVFAVMCDTVLDDGFKAASEMNTWVAKSGRDISPFHQRFRKTFYDFNDTVPGKAARFSNAMAGWADGMFIVAYRRNS
jgi:hypothetical protein